MIRLRLQIISSVNLIGPFRHRGIVFDLVLASAQFIIKWYAFRDTLINIYGYDNFYIFKA